MTIRPHKVCKTTLHSGEELVAESKNREYSVKLNGHEIDYTPDEKEQIFNAMRTIAYNQASKRVLTQKVERANKTSNELFGSYRNK